MLLRGFARGPVSREGAKPRSPDERRTIPATASQIDYLGDNYYGFQRRPDLVTVDSEVRKALAQIGVIHGDFCERPQPGRGAHSHGRGLRGAGCQVDEYSRERAVNRDGGDCAKEDVGGDDGLM